MANNDAARFFQTTQDPEFAADSRSRSHPDGDGRDWDDDFEEEGEEGQTRSRESEWSGVRWVQKDEESTEYRHFSAIPMARELVGKTFELTAQDLELLIGANGFEPRREGGQIIFGLRGAVLAAGQGATASDQFKQVGRRTLLLQDVRPDHRQYRCVLGVYDLQTGKLSAFIASTVPCREAVVGYTKGGEGCNMLPSGCYSYVCGPHKKRDGCLRENEDFNVLRSKRDSIFDVGDNWDLCFPADNIHPAFSNKSAQFSSWGCQTIRGNHSRANGSFSGEFKEFREVLGLKPRAGSHGERFSYVLLTGLEAAVASRLRKIGRDKDAAEVTKALGRLRAGSRGERVKALQVALGLEVDGIFDGAVKRALVERQRRELGWADGVYGPEMDDLLKMAVFKPAPAAPVAAPQPGAPQQPAPQPSPPPQQAPAPQPAPLPASMPAPAPVAVPPLVTAPAPAPEVSVAATAPAESQPAVASQAPVAAPVAAPPASLPPAPVVAMPPPAASSPSSPPSAPAPQPVASAPAPAVAPAAASPAAAEATASATAPVASPTIPAAPAAPAITAPPAPRPTVVEPSAPTPASEHAKSAPVAPAPVSPPVDRPVAAPPPAPVPSAAAIPQAPRPAGVSAAVAAELDKLASLHPAEAPAIAMRSAERNRFERALTGGAPAPSPAAPARAADQAGALRVYAGRLVERIPRTMLVGRREQVEVRLGTEASAALSRGLAGSGALQEHELPVVETMAVDLVSPDGAFEVEACSEREQLVKKDALLGTPLAAMSSDYGRWMWNVTPRRAGTSTLALRISARVLDSNGFPSPHTLVPDKEIAVEVRVNKGLLARRAALWIAGILGAVLATYFKDALYGALKPVLDGIFGLVGR